MAASPSGVGILATGLGFWHCSQQQKGHSWASRSLQESVVLATEFGEWSVLHGKSNE